MNDRSGGPAGFGRKKATSPEALHRDPSYANLAGYDEILQGYKCNDCGSSEIFKEGPCSKCGSINVAPPCAFEGAA